MLSIFVNRVYIRHFKNTPTYIKVQSHKWNIMREMCVSNGVQKREIIEIALMSSLNLPE
jgi:hypothetical protein